MSGRIRVLFVDHEQRLSGGQQDLVDLVAALDHRAVEVHVALPGPGALADRLADAGAVVHTLEMAESLRRTSRWAVSASPWLIVRRAGAFVAASRRLGRLIRRIRPEVVHTNSMKAHLVAIWPTFVRRVPLIWHVRDILQPGWLRTAFVRAGARFPKLIVCLSKATGEQFHSLRAQQKVRVVYNGIHLDKFRGLDVSDWRERLGAGEDDNVVVGMVGQIAHWKGQDVFVDAAVQVAALHPNARFAVVGECLFPENEEDYEGSIRRRAEDAGVAERIAWTGWTDDIPGVIQAFDVLVHASRLPEPFGRVMAEGMAAGKPVVGSLAGAGPEIVPAGAGRLVPPGDSEALASALDELLGDETLRRRCGLMARAAAHRFDIAETARGVMAAWAEVRTCA